MKYPVIRYIDVLVDGEFMQDKRDTALLWKGSSNQRVTSPVSRSGPSITP